MAGFKIVANPKFDADLTFICAGVEQSFKATFRHMGRKEFTALYEKLFDVEDPDKAAVDAVLQVVDSWDIECPLDEKNVVKLLDNYPGFAFALLHGYQQAIVTKLKGN